MLPIARKVSVRNRLVPATAAAVSLAVAFTVVGHAGRHAWDVDEAIALVGRAAAGVGAAAVGPGIGDAPRALDERTFGGALAASGDAATGVVGARLGVVVSTALAILAGLALAGHLLVSRVLARLRALPAPSATGSGLHGA
jgi:hypothetical protein